jgi:hypothetical protein
MRCFVVALILSLCSALPIAAHADTFNYTLTVDYPSNLFSDIDASIFDGTFSFSEPSLLTGLTSIYPPAFTEPNGSPVDLIQLGLFPSQNYYYLTSTRRTTVPKSVRISCPSVLRATSKTHT